MVRGLELRRVGESTVGSRVLGSGFKVDFNKSSIGSRVQGVRRVRLLAKAGLDD